MATLVDRAGQQAQHGVDDDHRRQLAARQHVVTDRQLPDRPARAHARRRPRSAGRRSSRCSRAARSCARPGRTAAARVEQDARRRRPGQRRAGRRRWARCAGSCRRHRRTDSRPRCGGARGPTRADRGQSSVASPRSRARPGMLAASGPGNTSGKIVTTSMRSAHGSPFLEPQRFLVDDDALARRAPARARPTATAGISISPRWPPRTT